MKQEIFSPVVFRLDATPEASLKKCFWGNAIDLDLVQCNVGYFIVCGDCPNTPGKPVNPPSPPFSTSADRGDATAHKVVGLLS